MWAAIICSSSRSLKQAGGLWSEFAKLDRFWLEFFAPNPGGGAQNDEDPSSRSSRTSQLVNDALSETTGMVTRHRRASAPARPAGSLAPPIQIKLSD